jgi:ABC-type molybdate transport system ATPase subunit
MTEYTLPIIDGIGQKLVPSSQVINQTLLQSYTKESQQNSAVNFLQGKIKKNTNPDLTTIEINNLEMTIPKLKSSTKQLISVFIPPNQVLVTPTDLKQVNTQNIYQGKVQKIDHSENIVTMLINIGVQLQIIVAKQYFEESKISLNQELFVIIPPSTIVVTQT